ncbi:MAG TPA: GvpL/GvpF family gas vesicle protein [Vicinamibacterales bacterium]|nr:GvpL/GvpF family gas vesicle protein [Vicinamibacterales bacterium]
MATASYLYCLVANRMKPRLARGLRGLPHATGLRLVALDRGLWLVLSDVPLAKYGEASLKRGLADLEWVSRAAVAHERVVESFLTADAVLPMKLFTMFESDERAAAHLALNRLTLDALVARVVRKDEWGIRVALDRTAAGAVARPKGSGRVTSGSTYLQRKKAQRDEVVHRAKRARAVAAELFDALAAHAAEARRRPATELSAGGGPLVLDAALLVPRTRSTKLKAVAARQARALSSSGYAVSLTGPWPPYSFMQD